MKVLFLALLVLGITVAAQAATLLIEHFDDTGLAARGWYDSTTATISSVEFFSGTGSLQMAWVQGGTTPTNGAAKRHAFTATETLYIQFYQKHSASWVGHGESFGHHEFYILTTEDSAFSGLAFNHLTTYIEKNGGTLPNTGSVVQVSLQDGSNIDQNQINVNLIGVTENRAVAGCNGNGGDGYSVISCFQGSPGTFWNVKQWKTTTEYFSDSAGAHYKGDWHKIGAYFQMNTISGGVGQANGILRYWFDDQLVIEHTNVIYRTGQHPNMKWNQFIIAPFMGGGSPVAQTFWMDELLIADSTGVTPAAPTGFKIQ